MTEPTPPARILTVVRTHLGAIAAYGVVAIVFSWPLALHLSTHLPGPPDGDTGVYVWNQWVFHHELIDEHATPYFTRTIFGATDAANLSLHNYTVLADLLALPMITRLGSIMTFNLVTLALQILAAYAMFLLARAVTGAGVLEAWIGGVLFAWSPMLVTRSTGHFSLVAAAPLPFFLLCLIQVDRRRRLRDAALLGVTVALAMWGDVYYPVYCVLLAGGYSIYQCIEVQPRACPSGTAMSILTTVALGLCGLVASIATRGGWQFRALGVSIVARTLYTPILALTCALALRWLLLHRLKIVCGRASVASWIRLSAVASAVAAALLVPHLYALLFRLRTEWFVNPPIFWRSSPPGVDLLAFFVPNPNHPLVPRSFYDWLARPTFELEHVASIPLTVCLTGAAAWHAGWRPARLWVFLGIMFTLLAMGPFLHVAGRNTYIPGPWALFRYVPVVGLARTPARLAVVVMLVASTVFTSAMTALTKRHGRSAAIATCVAVLCELLPAPRPLFAANVPAIYQRIAGDPRKDVAVLELPFGISSGAFSVGGYAGLTQLHQTVHGKRIVGGAISRVSLQRIREIRAEPLLDALIRLSGGEALNAGMTNVAIAAGPQFVRRVGVGYVVVNTARTPRALLTIAHSALRLEYLDSDRGYDLYRATAPE